MDRDGIDLIEARYESVISVDARRSKQYDDVDKPGLRARIYRVLETAFDHTKVASDAVHMEDRGDGVLMSVAARIAVTRLVGLWLVEVHEKLRDENRTLRVPLGLRIGMHVGPVRHDGRGISGRAVDLACGLADSSPARRLLDEQRADLVLVASQSLYEDVVSGGGKFIEPAHYSPARLEHGTGEITAWFHLPGRPAPQMPAAPPSPAVPPADPPPTDRADTGDRDAAPAAPAAPDSDSGDRSGEPGVHYTVHGDMSQHRGNVYQQPVHIGRVVGDTGPRRD
ncbi:hypothetical protein GCM10027168_01030 [Streptomyces capparidis]